ncbi:hypothetical protein CRENBAI_003630, partial [Crenichthys baileyi]
VRIVRRVDISHHLVPKKQQEAFSPRQKDTRYTNKVAILPTLRIVDSEAMEQRPPDQRDKG